MKLKIASLPANSAGLGRQRPRAPSRERLRALRTLRPPPPAGSAARLCAAGRRGEEEEESPILRLSSVIRTPAALGCPRAVPRASGRCKAALVSLSSSPFWGLVSTNENVQLILDLLGCSPGCWCPWNRAPGALSSLTCCSVAAELQLSHSPFYRLARNLCSHCSQDSPQAFSLCSCRSQQELECCFAFRSIQA